MSLLATRSPSSSTEGFKMLGSQHFLGSNDGVFHEHSNSHGADPTRDWRDVTGFLFDS